MQPLYARQLLCHPRSPAKGDPSSKFCILFRLKDQTSLLSHEPHETCLGRRRIYPWAFVHQDIGAPESTNEYLQILGFEPTSRAGMSCPCCLSCIKNINGQDLKHNWVKVLTQPATTKGKYFTGSFDIRFDVTGNGINPWGHTAFRVQHRAAWIPCSSHRAACSFLYLKNPTAIPWTAEVQLDKSDVEYRPSPARILPCNSYK